MQVRALFLLLLLMQQLPARAAAGIDAAWLREPPPGQSNAAIYLRLRNSGAAPLVVSGARVDGAASAALHQHTHENGMMRMSPAPPQTVAPGGELLLEPGGLHLMVFGLAERPLAGAWLRFCLLLQDGAESCGEAVVKGVGE